MCGICGFNWQDEQLAIKMNKIQKHRGPDDEGIYSDSNVTIGHVRLAIIDLSPAGKQPMSNEDGHIWITYNGEIYNFHEIKHELEIAGHKFRSKTDTEVILHAYEEWGTSCLDKFNGMWAFVIYDKNKNILLLSRDRFGIKPLYYYKNGDMFIFSSEIRGILEHSIERIPNDEIINAFLQHDLLDYSDLTFFKGITKVLPGEYLIFSLSDRRLNKTKWYDINERRELLAETDERHIIERVRGIFNSSIQYRLIADVPVGSCLSGGIDSSSIVTCMRKLYDNIKTFSLVFPGKSIDESIYIDEVVDQTGVESYKISPTEEDLLKDLTDLIWTQEEPFGTLSIYGQYKVMQLAHQNGMKVLLDGQGGDELFGGYTNYFKYKLIDDIFSWRFNEARHSIRWLNKKDFPILCAEALGRIKICRDWVNQQIKNILRIPSFGEHNIYLSTGNSTLQWALLRDLSYTSIPQLLRYEDKNSMRWSIESRVPFLDYRFVEYVTSLSSFYKIKNGCLKYIFRKAMKDILPEKIRIRKDKIGFRTPDEEWIRTPVLKEFCQRLMDSEKFQSRKYWNILQVKEEFLKLSQGYSDSNYSWKAINIELWLRMFIDPNEAILRI